MFAAPNIFLTGKAVAATDPYFYDVSLLLTGDGTNGAQNNTFLDSSTNNFTITRNGNTTQGTFSPYGSLWSNYFDGSGDWLTSATSGGNCVLSGNFTVEAWVYPTSWGAYQRVISGGASTFYWSLGFSTTWGGGLKINWYDGTDYYSTAYSGSPLNTWYHLAVVRTGSTIYYYINGVQYGTSSYSSTPGNANGGYMIGNRVGATEPWYGYISNARVVLGTNVYGTSSTITVPTTPLTAVSGTSLLTCQSNRFIDNSSNNFTLTVNGNTSVQRFSPFNPTAAYDAATLGGSGYFDGTGDCLTAPSDSAFAFGTGDFTVEGWFYQTADKTYPSALEIGNHLNTSGILFITKYAGTACIYSGAFYGGAATTLNQWNHIAWVRQSGSLKIYVNGVLGSTTAFTNNLTAFSTVTIGSESTVNASYTFPGYMSNLRAVKGTAVYTSNFTPPTSPLTAISGTSLLCNFTNAGIPDAAMMNDLETVGNAQVSTSVKKYGTGSLYFNGSTDYLTMADSPNLEFGSGDFTVEAWVYLTGYAPSAAGSYAACLLDKDSAAANSRAFSFVIQGTASSWTGIYVLLGNSSGALQSVSGSAALSLNTWYHIAYTRSNGVGYVFVNGTLLNSGTLTTDVVNTTVPVLVGAGGYSGYPYRLPGYIDDLRVTKGYARYTANFTPPTAALPTY